MVGSLAASQRLIVVIIAIAVATTMLLAAPSPAAAANNDPVVESIAFDIDGFQDLLLVEATDRLFVSGGANDSVLVVTDLEGTEVARKTGLSGVRQMAYDPVAGEVWVALADGPSVAAYDATTGASKGSIALPGMCPSAVAISGARLAVSSECDDQLAVINLGDDSFDVFPGFGGVLELAPSPPPPVNRIVMLTKTELSVLNIAENPPSTFAAKAVTGTSMATSVAGVRRVAVGTSTGVEIYGFPQLGDPIDTFALGKATVAIDWTYEPAVVGVNSTEALGLKPTLGPFWSFPVAPAVPFPNGIQAHSDGRIFIVAELPPGAGGGGDPGGGGGGGGIGVIVPGEGEAPASLSGNVGALAPIAPGEQPETVEVRLLDDDGDVLAVDTVPFGSGDYEFGVVQPGDYELEFWALTDGEIAGLFPERYDGLPLLSRAKSKVVALTDGQATTIDAELRPLYHDMFGNTFEEDIVWMGSTGITKGCNPPENTEYCPNARVTRGQMAAFLARALGLPVAPSTDFVDDDDSIFEADIEKLAAAGITKGCNPPVNDRFCPDAFVTRGQMAAFLNRALGLPVAPSTDFVDDDDSIFEADIEKLAAAGITKGCNPPVNDRFCPDAFVTRGQMAAFLNRSPIDGLG